MSDKATFDQYTEDWRDLSPEDLTKLWVTVSGLVTTDLTLTEPLCSLVTRFEALPTRMQRRQLQMMEQSVNRELRRRSRPGQGR